MFAELITLPVENAEEETAGHGGDRHWRFFLRTDVTIDAVMTSFCTFCSLH